MGPCELPKMLGETSVRLSEKCTAASAIRKIRAIMQQKGST